VRREPPALDTRCHIPGRPLPLRTGAAPRALASFRNLTLNTYRLAGKANIAHARRDLHDRTDTFAVYGI
jgi:hypothetical protein